MHYELSLRDYLRVFQKRKWIIILTPLIAGLLGYSLTQASPTMFEATGRLRVVSRSQPIDLMMQTFYYYEEGNRLDTHAEVMMSREVLKEVAMELGLIDRLNPDGSPVTDADISVHPEWRAHLVGLRDAFTPMAVGGTSILQVTASLPDRDDAITYLNVLLNTYAERNRYELNQDVIEGKRFLEDRLEIVEKELAASQQALVDFMIDNAGRQSLGSDEIAVTQRELQDVRQRLAGMQTAIVTLERISRGEMLPPGGLLASLGGEDELIGSLAPNLSSLDARRSELLAYQTPESPEVRAVESEIRMAADALLESFSAAEEDLRAERDRLQDRFNAMPANDAELERLRREVDLNSQIHTQLRANLEQANLRNVEQTQEIQIIERAIDAAPVVATGRASRGALAAVMGMLLGIVAALLLETLDTSIGAIDDVEALLDVPVIGTVPPIDFDGIRTIMGKASPALVDNPDVDFMASLVTHYDPRSPVSEAYRAIRTNVEKAREATDAKVVMVTSSVLEEGKTTTSTNIALAFAQMGRKTILVGADLRRPAAHRVYGLPREPGLADVLTGEMSWPEVTRGLSDILLGELPLDVVMLTPGMDNLHVLPSGTHPLNPAELLSSDEMGRVIAELRHTFDVIIIDTPPIIPVTDSAVLAEHTDGIVLVYEVGRVGRDVLRRAKSHFDNVDADVWGIVMNDVRADAGTTLRHTDYYYQYRYDESPTDPPSAILGSLSSAASKVLGRWV